MGVSKLATFRNILYSSFAKGITLCCMAATSLVVARNLTPSDYGVVGFATIIIMFLSHFSDMGVANAVIQRPTLSQHNLDSAFTLRILLSSIAFVVTLALAPYVHHFFDHPAIGNVIRVLALTFLISIIGFLPTTLLTREMNYRALVIPGIATAVVQCILAVTLVLHGWRYWAIVLGSVGATLAGGIAVCFVKRVPARLRFDLSDMAAYVRYGAPLFGTGVLVLLLFNLDNLLIGGAMGSVLLGYYALAFNWGSFICGLLYDTVNNVLFPAFSSMQHDAEAVKRWYLKTIDMVGFLAVIANGSLFANASYFLVTLLGRGSNKWVPATMALRILCLYGIMRAITEPLGSCLLARGRTAIMLRANALAGAVEVTLLILAIRSRSIELVAIAVAVAYGSQMLVYLPFLRRELAISGTSIAKEVWPIVPALASGWGLTFLLPASLGHTVPTFLLRGLLTAAVIAVVHGLFSGFRCFQEAGGMISQSYLRWQGLPRESYEAPR